LSVAVFLGLMAKTSRLVQNGALEQARSYADLLVTVRAWNADMGGVYVRKSDRVATNPHLVELGIDPDDALSDGTPITLRNPSVMTREIGDMLSSAPGEVAFKLTSLKPVNPDNAPDGWETDALQEFDKGVLEYWNAPDSTDAGTEFRYMRPLFVEKDCLTCHSAQGYRVGDIRGAISIRLPYADTARSLRNNRLGLTVVAVILLVGVWVLVLGSIGWLEKRLDEANGQLELLATTDGLTGLWNRRYVLEQLELQFDRSRRSGQGVGVVLVDIDNFKLVNDTYGHGVGDEVLCRTADVIKSAVRAYDTVGRIGGEELLVVAPDIDAPSLSALAERIRSLVESGESDSAGVGHNVTVSAGTALSSAGIPESADVLVRRADEAMYAAKAAGRNRVVTG
jgi:diguanylate cyclase (GGDEF)-like protein